MNSYGTKFRLSIFGESHGPLIGVVLDGVPAGMPLSREDFLADLDRRRRRCEGKHAPQGERFAGDRKRRLRRAHYGCSAHDRIPQQQYPFGRLFGLSRDAPSGPCRFRGGTEIPCLQRSAGRRPFFGAADADAGGGRSRGQEDDRPDRNPGPDHRVGRYSPRAAELQAGEGVGCRGCPRRSGTS